MLSIFWNSCFIGASLCALGLMAFSMPTTSAQGLAAPILASPLAQTNLSSDANTANQLFLQGLETWESGDFEATIQIWDQALEIYRKLDQPLDEANALRSIGSAYDKLKNYEQAFVFFRESLAIEENLLEAHGPYRVLLEATSASLNNLGAAYYRIGQYQDAIANHERALDLKRQVIQLYTPDDDIRQSQAITLTNLGANHYGLGQYEEAIKFYQQALTIKESIGDQQSLITSFNNLGRVYAALGDSVQSQTYYEKAITLREQESLVEREAFRN